MQARFAKVDQNSPALFAASDSIVRTKKALQAAKDGIKQAKAAKDAWMAECQLRNYQFEYDKYFKDLSWFIHLAGHADYMMYQ